MRNSSMVLKRLGVAGLSAVTIGAGVVSFAASSATAGVTDITGIRITPTSATSSTGDNSCQQYALAAIESSGNSGGSVTVTLTPGAPAIDSTFCAGSGGNTGGPGVADTHTFTLGPEDTVNFGVHESNESPLAGSIGISASPGSDSTPSGNAALTIVRAANQADAVTNLAVAPSAQTITTGTGTANYQVTATNGASSVVSAATIRYSVSSSQQKRTGTTGTCATGGNGVASCNVDVPTDIPNVQTGPYTVTFSASHGTAPATIATATLTTAVAAPGNATVQVLCGGADTERNAVNDCVVPTSSKLATFKADVTTPVAASAPAGALPAPVPGVVVDFSSSPATSNGPFSPTACITATDGTCSTVLTFSPTASGTTTLTATLSNGARSTGTVTISNAFAAAATNVRVMADSPTARVAKGDVVTATVTNQFGNPVGASNLVPVIFAVSGVGAFGNGSQSQTVKTNLNGQAQVLLGATSAGAANVTATIALGSDSPNCQSAAPSGGSAGKCSASATVTFTKGSTGPTTKTEHPVITRVSSGHKGWATIHVTSHPSLAGASVRYYTVSAMGNRHLRGTNRTDASGKASLHLRGLVEGKIYNFQVRVYNAHHKKIVPGLSATVSKQIA